MPGVWDALSVRIVESTGFPVAFLSGYATSATLLALPDFGYLTQGEMAEVARRVCRAAPDVAVVIDGDTGYGNALNTRRTVELFEAAGGAGIFLEDQVWPKKCGHMAGKRVVPRQEWLSKLAAAGRHPRHPVRRGPHRRPVRRRAGGGLRAGPHGRRPGRRRHLRRGAGVDRGAGGGGRGHARHRQGGQHDRGRADTAAHARRAPRPRLRPDRVAPHRPVRRRPLAGPRLRGAGGQGIAARRHRPADHLRRLQPGRGPRGALPARGPLPAAPEGE